MWRRQFLRIAGWSPVVACGSRVVRTRGPIQAVAFDMLTVFDVRTIDRRVAEVLGAGAGALAATWKTRLFEYCWIRATAARYVDFGALVEDSLAYALAAQGASPSNAERRRLIAAFVELEPWPDAVATLRELRERGLRTALLTNFSPPMIDALVARAAMPDLFDAQISTDAAQTYKPDPRAYALAEHRFALPREQIAFAAFASWDAAGATWFGFPTFWVDRLGVIEDTLITVAARGTDLTALGRWLVNR